MLYFFLFAVLFIPVYIRIKADTEKEALKIRADIVLPFKIKLYSGDITVKKVIASIFSGKKKRGNRAQIFNVVRKHAKIKRLKIKARIGTGEASSSAMLNGALSGLTAPFRAKENCQIDIIPEFNEEVFEFFGQGIFKTNLFHGLIAILKIYGGKKKWKSILLKT